MATTSPSDAVVVPQDPGTGTPSKDDKNSAGIFGLLGGYSGTPYHTLNLTADPGNEQVDVSSGAVFLHDTSSSTSNSRASSGNPQIQSTSSSGYDTEVVDDIVYAVLFPTANNQLSAATDTANQDVYVSVDPTAQNSATIHHGNLTSVPSNPYLKVGRFDTTANGVATEVNRRDKTGDVSSWADSEQQGERWTRPVPDFVKPDTNPILQGSNVSWTSSLSMPSFFHAGHFLSNPLGEYYNYYSSHSTEGLGLAYTDDLRTGWTDQGLVADGSNITGGSNNFNESDVIYDKDTGEIVAYANDTNSEMSRWLSSDNQGTTWSYDQQVDSKNNHAGYPRVFRHGSYYYISRFVNDGGNSSDRVFSYSEDGLGSWTDVHRRAGLKDYPTGVTSGDHFWEQFDYLPYFGGYLVAFTDKRASNDARIRLGYTQDGVTIDDWGVQVTADQTWEDSVVKYPNLFTTHDGTLGLLYAGGNNTGNSTDLGIALDESGVLT